MTIQQIINEVRYCIDEESADRALFGGSPDDTTMDHIIAAKIKDAIVWLSLHAPSEMLYNMQQNDTSGSEVIPLDFIFQYTLTGESSDELDVTVKTGYAIVEMPEDFVRLTRIRCDGWNRAVRTPIEEDSAEYLQLWESVVTATSDRPQAAVIRTRPAAIEAWPWKYPAQLTIVRLPEALTTIDYTEASSYDISVPRQATTAFIYYIAFLVMSAYNDTKAKSMLEIAMGSLGNDKK